MSGLSTRIGISASLLNTALYETFLVFDRQTKTAQTSAGMIGEVISFTVRQLNGTIHFLAKALHNYTRLESADTIAGTPTLVFTHFSIHQNRINTL